MNYRFIFELENSTYILSMKALDPSNLQQFIYFSSIVLYKDSLHYLTDLYIRQ